MSITLTGALLASSLSRTALLGLFSGNLGPAGGTDPGAFLTGLRTIMLVSGALSLAGVFTSLVRAPGVVSPGPAP